VVFEAIDLADRGRGLFVLLSLTFIEPGEGL
jgi:hypothetical protein